MGLFRLRQNPYVKEMEKPPVPPVPSSAPSQEPAPASQSDLVLEPAPIAALPDHPLARMKAMLLSSTGRLPMPLILIVLVALVLTVGTGVAMKMTARDPSDRFLPLRLTPDPAAPEIAAPLLQGSWTAAYGDKVMSLRLENNGFELIVKPPGNNYNRRFARGSYVLKGDVLVMTQRGDLGKPALSAEGLVFNPIGLASMNVKIRVGDDGRKTLMLWDIPASERAYQDRDVLSLFPKLEEKPLTWLKISGVQ